MTGLLFSLTIFLIVVLGIAVLFSLFNSTADKIDELCDLMKEPYDRTNYFENRIESNWKYIKLYRDEVAELGKVLYKIQCDIEDLQEKTKR